MTLGVNLKAICPAVFELMSQARFAAAQFFCLKKNPGKLARMTCISEPTTVECPFFLKSLLSTNSVLVKDPHEKCQTL